MENFLALPPLWFLNLSIAIKISAFFQALVCLQKDELEELAKIAQDQVKTLEENKKRQDFEFDSLQRRILELQSQSDEKVIIGKST